MVDCVTDAKPNTPFITGALSRSIRFDPAKEEGNTVVGVWGSFDINYALAVEMGNARLVGPEPLGGEDDSRFGVGGNFDTGFNHGKNNFLRGAADSKYPELPNNIRDRLGRLV